MRQTITTNIPSQVKKALRYYFARKKSKRLRRKLMPLAQKRGIFTDKDVFEQFS